MNDISTEIEQLQLPQLGVIEVTTLGVGAFEGESQVVHFGNGKWGIIDSCKTQDGVVLPLYYLEKLGVSYEDVAVVVCTHWHTDHIRGLNEIVNTCNKADFFFPMVGQKNNLLKLFIKGFDAQGRSGVWKEFVGSVKAAGRRADYSYPNCVLFDDQKGTQLVALSPSSKMLDILERMLLNFNTSVDNLSKISESLLPPNICSTALVLNTPDVHVLLGGDLESNRNKKHDIKSCVRICDKRWVKGWCNVVDKSKVLYGNSVSYFKLPHHASRTGYCDSIWTNKVKKPITAVSTVFVNNEGIKLPQKDMMQLYLNQSDELYLTSKGPVNKVKKITNTKSKLDESSIPRFKNIAVYNNEIGLVCSRKKVGQPWLTNILGTAIKVDQNFVSQYQP